MKVAVLGAGGQLGGAITEAFTAICETVAFTHHDLDVTDRAEVFRMVDLHKPTVLFNASGMTDVDGCERDQKRAYAVNALAPRWLAEAAQRVNGLFVHVSTDYVFDGAKGSPYHEWDHPRPVQTYGRSKLAGEAEVQAHASRYTIVRTSWLYGGPERGFVRSILRQVGEGNSVPLRVVTDQRGSPSYALDVARAVAQLIRNDVRGVIHVANEGGCSRHELAQEIVRLCESTKVVEAMNSKDLRLEGAVRPKDTSLESYVCLAVGVHLRPWQESLEEFLHGARRG